MATIADELLNDFEDSGSEQEEERPDDLLGDTDGLPSANGASGVKQENGSMELEDDEEEPEDADVDGGVPAHLKMEDAEDEEETKARVEKLELKAVSDVRSVAGLMKQLEPVIEVSPPTDCHFPVNCPCLHLFETATLTYRPSYRKSNTTIISRLINRRKILAT